MQNQNPTESELNKLHNELKLAKALLKRTIPYIQYHFDRSAVGTGYESKRLIEAIKIVLQEI